VTQKCCIALVDAGRKDQDILATGLKYIAFFDEKRQI
jgi:hypothetical protein